jgi:uncharacterized protein YndB with AHSA1/START domain
MPTFTTSIDIDAPPARVWEVMIDVERWHEWTPSITSIRRLDGGPLRLGSRALVRQPKLPANNFKVTEFEPDRVFTWVSKSPGVVAAGRHVVEPRGAGSHATLSVEFGGLLGWFVARLVGNLTERYIRMEAEGLKRRSELAG